MSKRLSVLPAIIWLLFAGIQTAYSDILVENAVSVWNQTFVSPETLPEIFSRIIVENSTSTFFWALVFPSDLVVASEYVSNRIIVHSSTSTHTESLIYPTSLIAVSQSVPDRIIVEYATSIFTSSLTSFDPDGNGIPGYSNLTGRVNFNETNGGLEGVDVCGTVAMDSGMVTDCTTTNADGQFTLHLPEGITQILVGKDGFSVDRTAIDTSVASDPVLTISTDTAHLGDQSDAGYALDPVNTAIGNFTHEHTDLTFKGRGFDFVFKRFYNSLDAYQGVVGHGWTHNYNIVLTRDGNVVSIKFGDGREEFYVRQPDGSYSSQPGVFNVLEENGGVLTLTDKMQTSYVFDGSDRLSSMSDRNGNTVSLAYIDNLLSVVTDPVGREVHFAYDGDNRLISLTDLLSRTIRFEYDSDGNLVSSFDAMGAETKYTYDANHQMLTATDPLNNVFVTNVYDAEKRVVTVQRDALGNSSTFSYNRNEQVTTIIDPLGQETVHTHDNRNRLIKTVDPLRRETLYEYDVDNNKTRVVNKRGYATLFTYDDRGNLTSLTDSKGNAASFAYDQYNNLTEQVDPLGAKTTFEYDAKGNLTKVKDPLLRETLREVNEFGQQTALVDARLNRTEFGYDLQGNLVEIKDALEHTQSFSFDAVGRKLTETNPRGYTASLTYDNNDNPLSVTDPAPFNFQVINAYDQNNNRLSARDRRNNLTAFAYDAKNRLETITDPLNNTIRYEYDALDRKTAVVDQRGSTITYGYDAAGNLVKVSAPLGNIVTSQYDANGNLLKVVNALGAEKGYTYDELDRLLTVRDGRGHETHYQYDAAGRLLSKIDANSHETRYEYDLLGKLTKVIEPDDRQTTYQYDEVGNKIGFTDARGNVFTYQYDELNRLTQDADGYRYEYDSAGNLIKRTDAKDQHTIYAYDELNRLTSVTSPDSSQVVFSYDANGNMLTMTDGLGVSSRVYDSLNRLTESQDPFGKTVGYGYDPAGNRLSITYPASETVHYEYDDASRLSKVTDWQDRVTNYSYDVAGKLAEVQYPNGTTSAVGYDSADRVTAMANRLPNNGIINGYNFSLDPVGNRTAIEKVEPLVPLVKNRTVTYVYDVKNQITALSNGSMSFDANGSSLAKTEENVSWSYSWNYENRLSHWQQGQKTVDYSYDGQNNRLASVHNGAATRYVLDVASPLVNVLAETDADGNITARNIYGLGLIARVNEQGTHYYHFNSLGSTIALSDENGIVTDKYAYGPFGQLANRAGDTENPFTFVGQYGLMDEGAGLYYVRARYYDSSVGRFLNRDSFLGDELEPGSLHRYAYVQNNPLGFVDVSGLSVSETGKNLLLTILGETIQELTENVLRTAIRDASLYRLVSLENIIKTTPKSFFGRFVPKQFARNVGLSFGASLATNGVMHLYYKHVEGGVVEDAPLPVILTTIVVTGVGGGVAIVAGAPAIVVTGVAIAVDQIIGKTHSVGGTLDPNDPNDAEMLKYQNPQE